MGLARAKNRHAREEFGKTDKKLPQIPEGKVCVTLSTREKGEDWRNLARLGRTDWKGRTDRPTEGVVHDAAMSEGSFG